jgi:thiamine pyrophosphokinase
MHALVIGGGELALTARVQRAATAAELIIAADSGARHLETLHARADVALGDFDSIDPATIAAGETIRYPVAKDDTDLALAVREAVRRGADRVTVIAAMRGPRLDHGAANLLLLSAPEFRSIDLRIIDGDDEARIVRRKAAIEGRPNDLVTLLAVTARCTGVTTRNLLYPLHGDTLYRGSTRGVSNVLTAADAAVMLEHGVLLLIHREGSDPGALVR